MRVRGAEEERYGSPVGRVLGPNAVALKTVRQEEYHEGVEMEGPKA